MENVLLNCDFRELLDMLPDSSVNLVIADVPYGKSYVSNHRKKTKEIAKSIEGDDDIESFADDFLSETKRVMKDNTDIYIFCSWDTYPRWYFLVKDYFKIMSLLVGEKPNKGMGDLFASYQANYEFVIHAQKGRRILNKIGRIERHPGLVKNIWLAHADNNDYVHPTQKNVDFCRFLIQKSSKKGDIVLDPFAGSGTTLVAAAMEGRKYIGCDISKEYFEAAKKRLSSIPSKLDLFLYGGDLNGDKS